MTTSRAVHLDIGEVLHRGQQPEPSDRMVFAIQNLYGVSPGATLPLNERESFETGAITLTGDPRSPATTSIGVVDFGARSMRVRYAAEIVFPALHELVMSGQHDLSLLHPIRATATDECKVTEDFSGWHAMGCLEILPGSMWSGAKGG